MNEVCHRGLVLLVYWGLTPQQQPGSYQGGEMMMTSVFWWRKPGYPEETTDLQQVTDETFHTYGHRVMPRMRCVNEIEEPPPPRPLPLPPPVLLPSLCVTIFGVNQLKWIGAWGGVDPPPTHPPTSKVHLGICTSQGGSRNDPPPHTHTHTHTPTHTPI